MTTEGQAGFTLLIIEDDTTIVEGLETAFKFHGFRVLSAGDGPRGMELLETHRPDLVILDVLLPGVDGFEICKRIRESGSGVPIIMLTARGQESDKLLGFERGADDYVTKPFSAKELIARVRAVLKRGGREDSTGSRTPSRLDIGEAVVDFEDFTVKKKNAPGETDVHLSPKEHAILKFLTENPGVVISRDRMIDTVWGDDYFPSPKTIDNFIRKLREKVEEDPKHPRHILTVHGVGYKFKF